AARGPTGGRAYGGWARRRPRAGHAGDERGVEQRERRRRQSTRGGEGIAPLPMGARRLPARSVRSTIPTHFASDPLAALPRHARERGLRPGALALLRAGEPALRRGDHHGGEARRLHLGPRLPALARAGAPSGGRAPVRRADRLLPPRTLPSLGAF